MAPLMDLATLSRDDDLLSDVLLDRIRFPNLMTSKMDPYYKPARGDASQVAEIVKEIRNGGKIAHAVAEIGKLAIIRRHLSGKSTRQLQNFDFHLRRYLETFMPQCGVVFAETDRYARATSSTDGSTSTSVSTPLTDSAHPSESPSPQPQPNTIDLAVVAKRAYSPGEIINLLKGNIADLTEEEDEELRKGGDMGFKMDFSVLMNPGRGTFQLFLGPARYVNHDCNNNVELIRQGVCVCFKVVRPIKAGDEILTSYGPNYFDEGNSKCLCGTCEELCQGAYASDMSTLPSELLAHSSSESAEGKRTRRGQKTTKNLRTRRNSDASSNLSSVSGKSEDAIEVSTSRRRPRRRVSATETSRLPPATSPPSLPFPVTSPHLTFHHGVIDLFAPPTREKPQSPPPPMFNPSKTKSSISIRSTANLPTREPDGRFKSTAPSRGAARTQARAVKKRQRTTTVALPKKTARPNTQVLVRDSNGKFVSPYSTAKRSKAKVVNQKSMVSARTVQRSRSKSSKASKTSEEKDLDNHTSHTLARLPNGRFLSYAESGQGSSNRKRKRPSATFHGPTTPKSASKSSRPSPPAVTASAPARVRTPAHRFQGANDTTTTTAALSEPRAVRPPRNRDVPLRRAAEKLVYTPLVDTTVSSTTAHLLRAAAATQPRDENGRFIPNSGAGKSRSRSQSRSTPQPERKISLISNQTPVRERKRPVEQPSNDLEHHARTLDKSSPRVSKRRHLPLETVASGSGQGVVASAPGSDSTWSNARRGDGATGSNFSLADSSENSSIEPRNSIPLPPRLPNGRFISKRTEHLMGGAQPTTSLDPRSTSLVQPENRTKSDSSVSSSTAAAPPEDNNDRKVLPLPKRASNGRFLKTNAGRSRRRRNTSQLDGNSWGQSSFLAEDPGGADDGAMHADDDGGMLGKRKRDDGPSLFARPSLSAFIPRLLGMKSSSMSPSASTSEAREGDYLYD